MVNKNKSNKVAKKGSIKQGYSPKTVSIFRDVVLSFSQDRICNKFKIKPVTLRKHKLNFRDRGWITKVGDVTKEGSKILDYVKGDDTYRLHNVRILIEVPKLYRQRFKKLRYNILSLKHINWEKKLLDKTDYGVFGFESVMVRVYPESIMIKFPDIWSKSCQECTEDVMELLFTFIGKLERLYRINLLIGNKLNIKVISNEYAHIKNVLATKYRNEKKTFFLKDGNNELRLKMDFSKGVPELESVHPLHAPEDLPKANRYIGDWLENNPPTNSELSEHFDNMQEVQKEFIDFSMERQKDVAVWGNHMKSHVKAIRTLDTSVGKLVGIIERLDSSINKKNQ